ncbi:CP family cyanate transporter-like MFS transporter [Agromyces sp. 3263]|uniref:MFS transporter n=1 Tax=Agromyces sp. 3263 TaxID=2817750 RepID=UPI0028664999|nr:MFS transporter [Agromyces sp. 3263]MDR6906390.1 CP family cyanate transporter-like MFS transporter [Agromyces sp. 3263]
MTSRPDHREGLTAAALILLIGLNLRDPITSVSAALAPISVMFGLTPISAATLSSLPVLMLALGAPLAPVLERRMGLHGAALALTALLTLSLALRPLDTTTMFVGTVLAGLGICGLSVLTPQLIRIHLAGRAGVWSGLFSTSFGVSAALGASLTIPLMFATGSVRATLALWAGPAAVATTVAAIAAARVRTARRRTALTPPAAATPNSVLRLRLDATALSVTAFFGSQALCFFAMTAWLPTIFASRGMAPAEAGWLLAWMSIAGLPASLLIAVIAGRRASQSVVVLVVSALSAVGMIGVAWAPEALAPVFVAVLGFAQGAAFGLAVMLIVLKAPPHGSIAGFSAFAQGVGYAFAALGPLALGLLHDAGLSWPVVVSMLLLVIAVQAVMGWMAGKPGPAGSADEAPERLRAPRPARR